MFVDEQSLRTENPRPNDADGRDWRRGRRAGNVDPSDAARVAARRAGYVGSIVVNAVLYYAVHHLLAWDVSFVTPAFGDVIWAFDLSIGATILANAFFLGYDERWFRQLLQIGLTGIAFVVASTIYGVFPFDFGVPGWNAIARTGLLLVMLATLIAMLAQIVSYVARETREVW